MGQKVLIINRCNTDNFGDRVIGHTMMQLFNKDDASYVISPRMHALILSLIFGIPCESIVISKKMESFTERYFPFTEELLSKNRKEVIDAVNEVLDIIH